MTRFGIYYIPPEDSDLYLKGSELLTWDIRKSEPINFNMQHIEGLREFDPEWVKYSRQYGFHMTIGDALDFDVQDLTEIENKLSEIISLFRKDKLPKISLSPKVSELRGPENNALVLPYAPNHSMLVLHSLVVALIHPLGKSSLYSRNPGKEGTAVWNDPADQNKIRLFNSPTAFDNYLPHFTLFNPLNTESKKSVLNSVAKLFQNDIEIQLESISIVVKEDSMNQYKIHKELHFKDF